MTDYNDWCSKVDRTDYSNDTDCMRQMLLMIFIVTEEVAKGNLTESVGNSG